MRELTRARLIWDRAIEVMMLRAHHDHSHFILEIRRVCGPQPFVSGVGQSLTAEGGWRLP